MWKFNLLAMAFFSCLVVVACVRTSLTLVGDANDPNNWSFKCNQNADCQPYGCCSIIGLCVSGQFKACKSSSATAIGGGGVTGENNVNNHANATFHSYKAEESRWDLNAANASCSTWLSGKPLTWRKKYGWAAFCAPHGPKDQEACGKCLKVTDAMTEAYETVRIVDKCGNRRGIILDTAIFRKLDVTGKGKIQGHLTVTYQFINCKD